MTQVVRIESGLENIDIKNRVGIVEQGPFTMHFVAASATDDVCGLIGAVGDYLHELICVVATAATSRVQLKDGGGTARDILPANVVGINTYVIPVNARCRDAGWKISTQAGVTVFAVGRFT